MTQTEAGHPALAFLNTVTDDDKSRGRNSFAGGEDFAAELAEAGALPADTQAPGPGQLTALIDLRETAYAVLSAIAGGRKPGREDALALETAIKAALQDATFTITQGGLAIEPGPLGGIHDHLVLGLFDLVERGPLDRLRECRRCTHLFLDHGRGSGRRWCSMSRCGNRAKAEAFRARQRGAPA